MQEALEELKNDSYLCGMTYDSYNNWSNSMEINQYIIDKLSPYIVDNYIPEYHHNLKYLEINQEIYVIPANLSYVRCILNEPDILHENLTRIEIKAMYPVIIKNLITLGRLPKDIAPKHQQIFMNLMENYDYHKQFLPYKVFINSIYGIISRDYREIDLYINTILKGFSDNFDFVYLDISTIYVDNPEIVGKIETYFTQYGLEISSEVIDYSYFFDKKKYIISTDGEHKLKGIRDRDSEKVSPIYNEITFLEREKVLESLGI
jgi:hypothetical protein